MAIRLFLGVGLVGWAQQVYPLYRNLVWNGGFEDRQEVIRTCSVRVETPSGVGVRVPYFTLTPTRKWAFKTGANGSHWFFDERLLLFEGGEWPRDSAVWFSICRFHDYSGTGHYEVFFCAPNAGIRRPGYLGGGERWVRSLRGPRGQPLYAPFYYLPWIKVAAMGDSSGVEVWGYALDTAKIQADTTPRFVEGGFPFTGWCPPLGTAIDSPADTRCWLSEFPSYRNRLFHPGAGYVSVWWGSGGDTLEAGRAYRLSTMPWHSLAEWRGVWAGNTRRAFQGIIHFAPGWVAMVGRPLFYVVPEGMETYRASIATSDGSWLENGTPAYGAGGPRRFQYPKVSWDLLNSFYLWRQVPDSAWWWGFFDRWFEAKGPFHIARLSSGEGYTTSGDPAYRSDGIVFAGNRATPLAFWEYGSLASSMERGVWRYVPGMSRMGWADFYDGPGYFPLYAPLWQRYYPSDRAFDYSVEGVWLGPAHGTRQLEGTYPERRLTSYFFWDGRSDVWYAVHNPFRRQVRDFVQWWGSLDSLWAEPTFPRIYGRCSWAGRMVGMGSSGFTAPIHSSVIALAHGAMPYLHRRDTFFLTFDTVVVVDTVPYPAFMGCWARPPTSWFRLDSIKMPGTLWDKLVWFTYGMAYSGLAPFTYLFSPVRSLMGQGWNYPIWHHRRLPEAPRPGFIVGVTYRERDLFARPLYCRYPLDIESSCPMSGDSVQVWLRVDLLPDTVRMLIRPGGVCAPLAPYRGEGYITISYPVREFHGFHTSGEWRAFLRQVSNRFGVRQALTGHVGMGYSAYDGVDRCKMCFSGLDCDRIGAALQAMWDTVLERASIRCGWPIFYSDFVQHFLWEFYMAAQDTYMRRAGGDLGWDIGEIRRRYFESCCGKWWNARTELGGSIRYPYEVYGYRPVLKWGPGAWTFPTGGGCPDRPRLVERYLDDTCRGESFCAGGCQPLRVGYTPLDTFVVQVKHYWDSVGYYSLDSLSRRLNWANLFSYWRYSRYGEEPTSWRYWLGLGRYSSWTYMYDSTGPVSGLLNHLRRNPWIYTPSAWQQRGEIDMDGRYYWSYRYPDAGCFISLNQGPVERCCKEEPYKVNRAYAIMGYLVDTLKAGKRYKVRMAVARAPWSRYVINNIGVVVSREPIPNVYPYCRDVYIGEAAISWEYPAFLSKSRWAYWENRSVRLDTTRGWVVLEGEITAKGGEKFIYVGWLDSLELDTVLVGWNEDTLMANGWMQGCLYYGGLYRSPDGYMPWSEDRREQEDYLPGEHPMLRMREWVRRWIAGGDASLHIDEVQLLEEVRTTATETLDIMPLRGQVKVWPGVCGGNGRALVEVWGGSSPYRCFWRRSGTQTWEEGCERELSPGMWEVRVIDAEGREMSEMIEVQTTPPINLILVGVDSVSWLGEGGAIVTVRGGTAPYEVWWVETGTVGETLRVSEGGWYTVWVRDSAGCTAQLKVYVPEVERVWVPSAFSPNGDGLNDGVAPVVVGRTAFYRFRIWDRWGHLIYESRQVGQLWDGTWGGHPVPEDVYAYTLEVTFEGSGRSRFYRGTITLVR